MATPPGSKPKRNILKLLYEIFFCTFSLVNVLFVLFDYTYLMGVPYTNITFRDVYLQKLPPLLEKVGVAVEHSKFITDKYDPVKDILPHRATDARESGSYLAKVDELQALLATADADGDRVNAAARERLSELEDLSKQIINKSPFGIARKNGTLEIIKDRVRDYVAAKDLAPADKERIGDSSKRSFAYFWSTDNITPGGYAAELAWFNAKIRPLIEQNYFRHIGNDGELVDNFYRLDLMFVAVFALDFLVRWFLAILGQRHRKWYLFPVTRWFELFNLLIPHHTAWLRLGRIIPFFVRMRENGFIPGDGILPGLVHENAGIIAEEISGLVLVRILAQMQGLIRTADLAAISKQGDAAMIEVQALLDSQTEVLAHGMIPVIQPQIADLVQHSIDKALEPWLLSPIGGVLRVGMIQIHKSVRDGLEAGLASDEAREQLAKILQKSTDAIIAEMTEPENLKVLQQNLDRVLGSVIEDLQISLKKQEAREALEEE